MVPATVVQGTWTCAQDSTNSTSGARSDSSAGLSGGAIAGIAIGAVAGVVLIVAGVVYFLKKKNKPTKLRDAAEERERARSSDDFISGGRKEVPQVAELHSPDRGTVQIAGNGQEGPAEVHSPKRGAAGRGESYQGGRAELDDGRVHARHELPGEMTVYEVAGDGPEREK